MIPGYNESYEIAIHSQKELDDLNELAELVKNREVKADDLQTLNFSEFTGPADIEIQNYLSNFPSLDSLNLELNLEKVYLALRNSGGPYNNLKFARFDLENRSKDVFYWLLNHCPNLNAIVLNRLDGMTFINKRAEYPKLDCVTIDVHGVDVDVFLWLSNCCPNLRDLILKGMTAETLINDDSVKFPNVQNVTLRTRGCIEEDVLSWVSETCPKLEKLVLSGHNGEKFTKPNANAKKFNNVKTIDIQSDSFTEESASWFCNVYSGLTTIILGWHRFERERVTKTLNLIPNLEKLPTLKVGGHEFVFSDGDGAPFDRVAEYHIKTLRREEQEDLYLLLEALTSLKLVTVSGDLQGTSPDILSRFADKLRDKGFQLESVLCEPESVVDIPYNIRFSR